MDCLASHVTQVGYTLPWNTAHHTYSLQVTKGTPFHFSHNLHCDKNILLVARFESVHFAFSTYIDVWKVVLLTGIECQNHIWQ